MDKGNSAACGDQNEMISPLLWPSLTNPSAAGGTAWPSEMIWLPKHVWWLQTGATAVPHLVLESFLVSAQVPCKPGFPRAGIPTLFPQC